MAVFIKKSTSNLNVKVTSPFIAVPVVATPTVIPVNEFKPIPPNPPVISIPIKPAEPQTDTYTNLGSGTQNLKDWKPEVYLVQAPTTETTRESEAAKAEEAVENTSLFLPGSFGKRPEKELDNITGEGATTVTPGLTDEQLAQMAAIQKSVPDVAEKAVTFQEQFQAEKDFGNGSTVTIHTLTGESGLKGIVDGNDDKKGTTFVNAVNIVDIVTLGGINSGGGFLNGGLPMWHPPAMDVLLDTINAWRKKENDKKPKFNTPGITHVNNVDILSQISKLIPNIVKFFGHPDIKTNQFNDYELHLYFDAIKTKNNNVKMYLISDVPEVLKFNVFVKDEKNSYNLLNKDNMILIDKMGLYENEFPTVNYKGIKELRVDIFNSKGKMVKRFTNTLYYKNTTNYKFKKIEIAGNNVNFIIDLSSAEIKGINKIFKPKEDSVSIEDIKHLVLNTENFPDVLFNNTILSGFPDALKENKAQLSNNIINFIGQQKETAKILGTTTFDEGLKKTQLIDMAKTGISAFIESNKIFLLRLKFQENHRFSTGDYIIFNKDNINLSTIPYGDYIVELYYLDNSRFKLIDLKVFRVKTVDYETNDLFKEIKIVHLSDHDIKNKIVYWKCEWPIDYYNVDYVDVSSGPILINGKKIQGTISNSKVIYNEKINTTCFEYDDRLVDKIIITAYQGEMKQGSYVINT